MSQISDHSHASQSGAILESAQTQRPNLKTAKVLLTVKVVKVSKCSVHIEQLIYKLTSLSVSAQKYVNHVEIKNGITKMYRDGHVRAKNQSNWSKASTVYVQKVRGQTYYVPPDFKVGVRAPRPPVPKPMYSFIIITQCCNESCMGTSVRYVSNRL